MSNLPRAHRAGHASQYREPLFVRIYEEPAAGGIELRVAYSRLIESHRRRNDNVDLPAECLRY
jgi:hypothetical protein